MVAELFILEDVVYTLRYADIVVLRTGLKNIACGFGEEIISLPPFRFNNCIVYWFNSPKMQKLEF